MFSEQKGRSFQAKGTLFNPTGNFEQAFYKISGEIIWWNKNNIRDLQDQSNESLVKKKNVDYMKYQISFISLEVIDRTTLHETIKWNMNWNGSYQNGFKLS